MVKSPYARPVVSQPPMLVAALGSVARGLHVFPCEPQSKHPRWKEWQHRATTSEAKICQWWTQRDAVDNNELDNPAIATGLSNLVILDEDTLGEVVRLFETKGWTLPETFTVLTSKGRHYYFAHDHAEDRIGNVGVLKKDGFNVDIRGDGGQVLAPGAVHASGVTYRVENDLPVAPLPGPLRDLLLSSRSSQTAGAREVTGEVTEAKNADAEERWGGYRDRVFADEVKRLDDLPKPWSSGAGWDTTTYEVACNLLQYANSPWFPATVAEVVGRLTTHAPTDTEWTLAQVVAKIESARQTVNGKSRPEPSREHDPAPTPKATSDLLEQAVTRERVAQEARAIVAEERQLKRFTLPAPLRTLADELAMPVEDEVWSVERLLPAGGNLLIAAGYKTGKTTLIQNLVRSLVDGEPFLDEFETTKLSGRVALFNLELTRAQQVRWLRDSGIGHTEQVVLSHLRGLSGVLTTQTGRNWITEQLKRNEVEFWVLDPLARAMSGIDENSNTEVGLFLEQLDEIKSRAGVQELALVAHTGRGAPDAPARARGATRVNDWADVNLTMVKDGNEVRSFTAEGRDVLEGKTRLTYDPATRRLAVLKGAELQRASVSGLVGEVVSVARPFGLKGASGNDLDKGVKGKAEVVREARAEAIRLGLLRVDNSGTWPRFVAVEAPVPVQEKAF